MATVSNTLLYKEDWSVKLQERLNRYSAWKDVCRVEFTNSRVLNNPFIADITTQTLNRGSQYSYRELSETNETRTINVNRTLALFIAAADIAQSDYLKQMELAAWLGDQMNEAIDTYCWSSANLNTLEYFDNVDIGGAAGSIDVSITNVDDIIRNVRRLIFAANGGPRLQRDGGFFLWQPADFMELEAFAQANGFNTADNVLKNGIEHGFSYGGFDHYVLNSIASTHNVAGVKKQLHLGIHRDTYGQLMIDEKDPAQLAGTGFRLQTDMVLTNWERGGSLVFDIATTTTV